MNLKKYQLGRLNKVYALNYILCSLKFIIPISIIFLNSCSENIYDDSGGPGMIVPGKSIEGVNLGDSREIVEQKLGPPTKVGWSDGFYRGWRSYAYEEGIHSGIYIDFIDYGESYGPVDAISVGKVPFKDSLFYNGKTKEGIGIGSSINDVHRIYGDPKYTMIQGNWIADFYCIYKKNLKYIILIK